MASQNKINMPGVFGGLMRYDEEYTSRFLLTPGQVVGGLVALAVIVIGLKFLFPIGGI